MTGFTATLTRNGRSNPQRWIAGERAMHGPDNPFRNAATNGFQAEFAEIFGVMRHAIHDRAVNDAPQTLVFGRRTLHRRDALQLMTHRRQMAPKQPMTHATAQNRTTQKRMSAPSGKGVSVLRRLRPKQGELWITTSGFRRGRAAKRPEGGWPASPPNPEARPPSGPACSARRQTPC